MSYLALYREWRPRVFREIVGQRHVSKTLANALRMDKIAHAYLFSGPRGTGKTTTAKILAKALNCDNPDGFEPCNQCPSCVSIDQGNAMDVLEIDAASNRGIDEIRDLREKVKLATAKDKYKVYIIDEVHMLTTEAFNALLKTLEEPPRRVVFVLATTEVHRIPLTILSRVQRFEFQRISTEDIQKRLEEVCLNLGRSNVEPGALRVIAQKSEGGLRDALSILDQCLILEEPLGVEQVYQVLGMVGETFSAELTDALLQADYAGTLQLLAKGVDAGRDPRQVLHELLDYLRQALLTSATGHPPGVAPHLVEKLTQQSQAAGLGLLLSWIGTLLQGESQLKYAANARLAAELLLVQTIYNSQAPPGVDSQVTEKLRELEGEIRGLRSGIGKAQPGERGDGDKPASARASAPKDERNSLPGASARTDKRPASPSQDFPDQAMPVSGAAKPARAKVDLTGLQARWPEILEAVRKNKRSTHAFLLEGQPWGVADNTLTLVFREGYSFHRDKVDQPENRSTIEGVLQEVFGIPITLCSIMEKEAAREAKAPELKPDDLVQKAVDFFGQDLVVVKE